jgi:BirA family transcriptional regulator, biotin operon repressor / biotin---[acetyl-CoA-carboxylase] ligase
MPSTAAAPDPVPDAALAAAFAGCLPAGRLAGPLHAFRAVDSTQTVCRRLGDGGAPEGTVVVADAQWAGRGQRGRTWTAPPGTGLLVSCLLRPPLPPARWPELTLLAAGAVVEAVGSLTSLRPAVRAPNDVYAADRKLAGVLAESVVGAAPLVVLGVGLNVSQQPDDWPPDLRGRAVSLAELGATVSRPALLAELLRCLASRYEGFLAGVTSLVEWS